MNIFVVLFSIFFTQFSYSQETDLCQKINESRGRTKAILEAYAKPQGLPCINQKIDIAHLATLTGLAQQLDIATDYKTLTRVSLPPELVLQLFNYVTFEHPENTEPRPFERHFLIKKGNGPAQEYLFSVHFGMADAVSPQKLVLYRAQIRLQKPNQTQCFYFSKPLEGANKTTGSAFTWGDFQELVTLDLANIKVREPNLSPEKTLKRANELFDAEKRALFAIHRFAPSIMPTLFSSIYKESEVVFIERYSGDLGGLKWGQQKSNFMLKNNRSFVLGILYQLGHHLKKLEKLFFNHNDIADRNIVVNLDTGETKLIDFGLLHTPGLPDQFISEWEKTSPEEVEGFRVHSKTDMFGLGLVAYPLLASPAALQMDQNDFDSPPYISLCKDKENPLEKTKCKNDRIAKETQDEWDGKDFNPMKQFVFATLAQDYNQRLTPDQFIEGTRLLNHLVGPTLRGLPASIPTAEFNQLFQGYPNFLQSKHPFVACGKLTRRSGFKLYRVGHSNQTSNLGICYRPNAATVSYQNLLVDPRNLQQVKNVVQLFKTIYKD